MATIKRIIVLANSIKHYPCTCIAGREVLSCGSGYAIGPWIRPVSSHDEGGISPSEAKLQTGHQPVVMDFVELTLAKHADDRLQPENWLIDAATGWRSLNKQYASQPDPRDLVEAPKDLWYQKNEQTDRISSAALKRNPPAQSIYLIHVGSLKVSFGWRLWDEQYKARRRVKFRYNNIDYDLGITDPRFLEQYRTMFPEKGKPPKEFEVKPENGCYLCVSLAPEFNEYHYKVVATIFE